MSNEPIKIPTEIIEKELRYRIMAKLHKIRQMPVDDGNYLYNFKLTTPIAIAGNRFKVSPDMVWAQIETLKSRNLLYEENSQIKITKLGDEFAISQKGESSTFLSDY